MANIIDLVLKSKSSEATAGIDKVSKAMSNLKSITLLTTKNVINLFKTLSKITDYSDEYTTSLRLLKSTLGDAEGEASKFISRLSDMSGISTATLNKQTAKFVQLGESLSFSNEQAEKFSENLSILSTKLSMLYNTDYQTMANALQKAVQGSQVTLKSKTGIAINDVSLQATLNANAIDREVSSLNDAEKAIVRYATILRQVTGDTSVYQNAVNSLAWQKQMLSNQIKKLAAAVGQVLTPVMTQLYIVLNAIVMVITEIVKMIGQLIGVSVNLDTSVASTADSYDNLGASIGKASNAAKKSLRGFDKLNNITTPSAGGGAGGAGLGIDNSVLDLLKNVDENFLNIRNKATEIRDKILEWFGLGENKNLDEFKRKLEIVAQIVEGLITGLIMIKAQLSLIQGLGIWLIIDGARKSIQDIVNFINDKSWTNFSHILKDISEILVGTGFLVGITSNLGIILAVIAQIVSMGSGIIEWISAVIKFLKDPTWENYTDTIRAGIKGMGLIGDIILWVIDTFLGGWKNITKKLKSVKNLIDKNVINPIKTFFKPLYEWFKDNVIEPIEKIFSKMWEEIKEPLEPLIKEVKGAFDEAWQVLQIFWSKAKPFFDKIWEGIKLGFKLTWEAIKVVWDKVKPYFEAIWETIKKIFSVVKPILSGFFSTAWEAIKAVWNNTINFFTVVWAGIKAVFSVVKGVLTGDFSDAWESIKNVWSKVQNFFQGIWEGIKSVFGSVADWFRNTFSTAWEAVKAVFSTGGRIFEGIKDGISSTITSAINVIIRGMNTVISIPFNRLNNILRNLRDTNIFGFNPFWWVNTVPVPQIPTYAKGGFPTEGEMFIAREAGAEMVGSINGHTAVANNDQIVKGIQSGVFSAMMSALNNTDFGGSQVTIEASGDTEGLLNFIEFKQKQKSRQFN